MVRRLQRVCSLQGGADAFAKRIHSRFSNRRVSDLVEATPSTKKNISFDVKKFFHQFILFLLIAIPRIMPGL